MFHLLVLPPNAPLYWIPASAGMTKEIRLKCHSREGGERESRTKGKYWIPASAGMTNLKINNDFGLLRGGT